MTGKGRGSHSGRWRGGRRSGGADGLKGTRPRLAPPLIQPDGRFSRIRLYAGASTAGLAPAVAVNLAVPGTLGGVYIRLPWPSPVPLLFLSRAPQCPAFIPHRFDCPLNPHDDAGLRPLQLHSPSRERRGSRLSYLFYLFYLKAHSMRLTVVATGSFSLCRAFGFRLTAFSLLQLSVVNNPIRSAGLLSACHPAAASIAHTRFPKRATIPRMPPLAPRKQERAGERTGERGPLLFGPLARAMASQRDAPTHYRRSG